MTPLEEQILAISVPDFDAENVKTRRLLVRQRFILGLVEMFEKFDDLDFVLFCPEENVSTMIQIPKPDHQDKERMKDWMALSTRIQKSLQKARAAISPQFRDTRSALTWFFGSGPLYDNQRRVRLDRHLFSRENLPRLCDPELLNLTKEVISDINRQKLEGIAKDKSATHTPSGKSIKM